MDEIITDTTTLFQRCEIKNKQLMFIGEKE